MDDRVCSFGESGDDSIDEEEGSEFEVHRPSMLFKYLHNHNFIVVCCVIVDETGKQ